MFTPLELILACVSVALASTCLTLLLVLVESRRHGGLVFPPRAEVFNESTPETDFDAWRETLTQEAPGSGHHPAGDYLTDEQMDSLLPDLTRDMMKMYREAGQEIEPEEARAEVVSLLTAGIEGKSIV